MWLKNLLAQESEVKPRWELVILSVVAASLREAATESKDPYGLSKRRRYRAAVPKSP